MRAHATSARLRASHIRTASLVVFASVALSCAGHTMMPTPNLYLHGSGYPADSVPNVFRSNRIDLLYATDRLYEENADPASVYGSRRSKSLAFGSVVVGMGPDSSWRALVEASGKSRRRVAMRVLEVRELGRLAESPTPFTVIDGKVYDDPDASAAQEAADARLRAELERRLDIADTNEVFVFIHGFNTTFEKAALLHAEFWHFVGRRGVPVIYSWPAATRGLLGYMSDRESGEFTVFHLKQFLRVLADTPRVERIHILAHSRGADVATTALRELVIAVRASGREVRDVFRIANLVLVAPDLDFGTVGQRLIAERFGPAFGHITIYTDQSDRALDVSELLFGGVRFGRLREEDLDLAERDIFQAVGNVDIVESSGATDRFRHEYFRSSREASSDLILLLRDGLAPEDPGRPLIHQQGNFWSIPRGYPTDGIAQP